MPVREPITNNAKKLYNMYNTLIFFLNKYRPKGHNVTTIHDAVFSVKKSFSPEISKNDEQIINIARTTQIEKNLVSIILQIFEIITAKTNQ